MRREAVSIAKGIRTRICSGYPGQQDSSHQREPSRLALDKFR